MTHKIFPIEAHPERLASTSAAPERVGTTVRDVMEGLHNSCGTALATAFLAKFDGMNGASYAFAGDLDRWTKILRHRPENALFETASSEYVLALLSNLQGQYRNAFKSLRLVLELLLQGVLLSVNLITLHEWLNSQSDTSWQTILDSDKGVFAKRFCRAFFPTLEDELGSFRSLAETLYREMSECTHGNVPNKIPLPKTIGFDEGSFLLWHEKARLLRFVANFTLTMRYFEKFNEPERAAISPVISDCLGHIAPIRLTLGGPT